MADSIFTKIIKGEIPAEKIYEDDLTFVILTIMPVQPGHTLVIPKKQVAQLWDLPEDDYRAVMATAKKIAKRMRDVLDVKMVGMKVIGEEVPHAHVHLIPFNTIEEFKKPSGPVSNEVLAAMAQKLRFK